MELRHTNLKEVSVARRRRHSKSFKLSAIARMEMSNDVAGLAVELGIDRGLLYKWQRAYRLWGEAGLRFPGERSGGVAVSVAASDGPAGSAGASARMSALERKVAEQALELDFFRAALQHFASRRRAGGGTGGTGSTP